MDRFFNKFKAVDQTIYVIGVQIQFIVESNIISYNNFTYNIFKRI